MSVSYTHLDVYKRQLLAQAKKYEKVNNGKDNKVHLLTGLLKCPIGGAGMYGNKRDVYKRQAQRHRALHERPAR